MNNSNRNSIRALYQVLAEELMSKEPPLSLRTAAMPGWESTVLARPQARYFISILEDHILEHSQSVVFTMEVDEDAFLLRLCCPIRKGDYGKLRTLNFTPPLRSKWRLTVGLGPQFYAYSAVKISANISVMSMFDALRVLEQALEDFLNLGQGGFTDNET